MANIFRKNGPVAIGFAIFFLLILVVASLWDRFTFPANFEHIMSRDKIRRMELRIFSSSDSGDMTITDSADLAAINRIIRHSHRIPERNSHPYYYNSCVFATIYKDHECDITIVDSKIGGWAWEMNNRWFRSDSLEWVMTKRILGTGRGR